MPLAGPWFFAWVDEGTAFNPGVHNVMDEYIVSLKRVLREGDKPTLELVIRNPHIGLLNTSRKQWAWLSRDTGSTAGIVPVFYGRLIAAPKDIFKELMTINMVAWPLDYVNQRQALAEEIKLSGPYDPVFIDVEKRDDPDALLEAVSGLYHVDPVTHVVSVSDILDGEDGDVDVTADDHVYDDFNAEFDQTSTLTAVLIDATVTWNQTAQGFIDMGSQTINTYAGDSLISEWPKPLQSLGGGYTVVISSAVDANGTAQIMTPTVHSNWQNKEQEHSDGDQLSLSISTTAPQGGSTQITSIVATFEQQIGFIDAFAVDVDGDPSPTNIPPHHNISYLHAPIWKVVTQLGVVYRDLDRQRTERIQMLLKSDLQNIIVRPEVTQNSETIVKSGADIGVPIVHLLNWTTIAGQHVDEDTIVFPDHPSLPGRRSAQICIVAGTAGVAHPTFSDVPGDTTIDGGVTWASLGTPAPTETAFDWPANSNVGLGTIILPRKQLVIKRADLIASGLKQFPPVGTPVGAGTVVDNQICTVSGIIGSPQGGDSAEFISFANPDGKTHYMCVVAGKTGALYHVPSFNSTLHARTTDGTVVWAAIGVGDIPAGGTPGDVWARSYFDTARGHQSIEYLASIARARARLKARAVTVSFTPIDAFGLGFSLTCRKTVTLHDNRVGGGACTGKVTYVEHICDGRSGHEGCRIEIGCAIGKDNVIEAVTGEETYCIGYTAGYRVFTGTTKLIGDKDDIGYTPPVFTPNDDGLSFPLSKSDVVISEAVKSHGNQSGAVGKVLADMARAAQIGLLVGQSTSPDYSASMMKQAILLGSNSINVATSLNPIWFDAVWKPLTGWQFNNFVIAQLTDFTCRRGIDLEAASTP